MKYRGFAASTATNATKPQRQEWIEVNNRIQFLIPYKQAGKVGTTSKIIQLKPP